MSLIQIRRPSTHFAMPFKHRTVADKVLITNTEGRYLHLTPDEFFSFMQGNVDPESELYKRLSERNFVRATAETGRLEDAIRVRKGFLDYGPNLHILVTTLRCNETCVYCHASRADMDAVHTDMTMETAEKTVDQIFQSTNPNLTIEFQGGEPLVVFPVLQHVIEYARQKNQTENRNGNKALHKRLEFTMVSNLSLMDEEKLRYLVENKVQVCTSIDGPPPIHDKQRKLPGLSAHASATHWIKRLNEAYVQEGLDPTLYHVEALLTTTRETLPHWKEVVDAYVGLGCRALFLRPVDPFGFADKTGHRIEYPRSEYMQFYRNAVDYMIELNKQGVEILERFAAIFLTKILKGHDPNFLDIRSPCGAGIGQVAYNYDGKIFTCDEGRMLHEMGDDTFLIGDVRTSRHRDVMGHETVRAMAIASNLEAQPDCVNCTYQPYCGVCPVHSHKTQGSIFGRMRESTLCAVHKGIQDYLFERLGGDDAATVETLRKWTTERDRSHFVQVCAG